MASDIPSRRDFLKEVALTAGLVSLAPGRIGRAQDSRSSKLHVACNAYSWTVFFQRQQRDFNASLDEGLAEVAASGLDGFEPSPGSPADIDRLAPLLKKHGLEMRSLYVNSVLHEADQADQSIAQVLAIARKARTVGTRIIVTNPSPIQWGGPQNKTDAQLRTQAAALDRLGAELRSLDLTLAYHNHDIELRNAAREFHHMMVGTDPDNVSLCLDTHWVYRGAGNSQVALFDVVKLYGRRVSELHLRQSRDGVWTEVFGPGDIDYLAVVEALRKLRIKPLVVLEQAIESGSPDTMKPLEAFKASTAYTRKIFAR